jgi:hypothetical protein
MRYLTTGLLLSLGCCWAAADDPKQLLQDLLAQSDLHEIQDMGALAGRLDVLRSAPVEEARQVFPLALSLLRSENPAQQSAGTMALVSLALRPDSAELMGRSIPELVSLLNSHDQTHAGTAIGFLALLNPRPPTSVQPYLLPLLSDSKASAERLLAILRTLVRAAPDDPATIEGMFSVLQARPAMKADIVGLMGEPHTSEKVLALLGACLSDPDANVRLAGVQAVGHQRPETIRGFESQLRGIAANPNEQSSTRDFASLALKQAR